MIVIVMGVSGAGKTTVGLAVAERMGCTFIEADEYHPHSNVEKMRSGVPLTDADREPWLDTLADLLRERAENGESVVLACSALKERYREKLRVSPAVRFVYLYGSREILRSRLAGRTGHFMNPGLLDSQLATLEEPKDALRLDIAMGKDALVDAIVAGLEANAVGKRDG